MKALVTWSAALTGLMMILVGSMTPAAIMTLGSDYSPQVLALPSTWQVPALLLCSLVCGANAGVIAAVAYITIGLFQIPVFSNGGDLSYLTTPGFGYLLGFLPSAWISGSLSRPKKMHNVVNLSLCAVAGLITLHICGIINLIIGSLMNRWSDQFPQLLFNYTIFPISSQIALCSGAGILAVILRSLLLIE